MRFALRSIGWLFISAGMVVALYLFYSLYWTGIETSQAQEQLRDDFAELVAEATPDSLQVGELPPLDADAGESREEGTAAVLPEGMDDGEVIGLMEFYRPGEDSSVVIDEPVAVVQGVTVEALKDGPGRYPGTAYPGQDGNFAVAGHRTTYGAPFWDLDKLQEGDEIHVTDRNGTRWIYEFVEQEIVGPGDISVLEQDPLELGRPMLTLTTCNPRWSQRERLIVFAELSEDQLPMVAQSAVGV